MQYISIVLRSIVIIILSPCIIFGVQGSEKADLAEDALKAIENCMARSPAQWPVDIYRRLAKDRPDAFLPDLARSLGVLGTCLHAATQLHDAVEAFREGVQILKPAFLKLPSAFAQLMGALLSEYISHAKELGETTDMEMLAPIIAKFEEIKDKK
ncbi:MAG: hypothetical protein JXA81_09185 [Sedimentisphaerales bacterium]|nr:hypothetical protein [Sedimentisphaerales bacterium]